MQTDDCPALSVDHIGISVPDLDASIDWYSRMFGFDLELRQHLPVISAEIAFLRRGELRVELVQVESASAPPPDRREPNLDVRTHGNKHLCYSVADAEGTINMPRIRGADIVFEKTINGMKTAFIRDNAGNLIELIERSSDA